MKRVRSFSKLVGPAEPCSMHITRVTGFTLSGDAGAQEGSSSDAPKMSNLLSGEEQKSFQEMPVGSPPTSNFNPLKFLGARSAPTRPINKILTMTKDAANFDTSSHYKALKMKYFMGLSRGGAVVQQSDGSMVLSPNRSIMHHRSKPIPIRR